MGEGADFHEFHSFSYPLVKKHDTEGHNCKNMYELQRLQWKTFKFCVLTAFTPSRLRVLRVHAQSGSMSGLKFYKSRMLPHMLDASR